jgi:hypothetical protein
MMFVLQKFAISFCFGSSFVVLFEAIWSKRCGGRRKRKKNSIKLTYNNINNNNNNNNSNMVHPCTINQIHNNNNYYNTHKSYCVISCNKECCVFLVLFFCKICK